MLIVHLTEDVLPLPDTVGYNTGIGIASALRTVPCDYISSHSATSHSARLIPWVALTTSGGSARPA